MPCAGTPCDFNHDFGVSFMPEERSRGEVFHTYSTYGRGVEVMMGTYALLDLAPKGRDEHNPVPTMDWARHHDRYEPVPAARPQAAASCCHAQA